MRHVQVDAIERPRVAERLRQPLGDDGGILPVMGYGHCRSRLSVRTHAPHSDYAPVQYDAGVPVSQPGRAPSRRTLDSRPLRAARLLHSCDRPCESPRRRGPDFGALCLDTMRLRGDADSMQDHTVGSKEERIMIHDFFPDNSRDLDGWRHDLAPTQHETWRAFSKATFAAGALDEKTKQLNRHRVAHATQCPWCITGHTRGAAKAGATPEEIRRRSGSPPRCAPAPPMPIPPTPCAPSRRSSSASARPPTEMRAAPAVHSGAATHASHLRSATCRSTVTKLSRFRVTRRSRNPRTGRSCAGPFTRRSRSGDLPAHPPFAHVTVRSGQCRLSSTLDVRRHWPASAQSPNNIGCAAKSPLREIKSTQPRHVGCLYHPNDRYGGSGSRLRGRPHPSPTVWT